MLLAHARAGLIAEEIRAMASDWIRRHRLRFVVRGSWVCGRAVGVQAASSSR
jgi:hypothetical protein